MIRVLIQSVFAIFSASCGLVGHVVSGESSISSVYFTSEGKRCSGIQQTADYTLSIGYNSFRSICGYTGRDYLTNATSSNDRVSVESHNCEITVFDSVSESSLTEQTDLVEGVCQALGFTAQIEGSTLTVRDLSTDRSFSIDCTVLVKDTSPYDPDDTCDDDFNSSVRQAISPKIEGTSSPSIK